MRGGGDSGRTKVTLTIEDNARTKVFHAASYFSRDAYSAHAQENMHRDSYTKHKRYEFTVIFSEIFFSSSCFLKFHNNKQQRTRYILSEHQDRKNNDEIIKFLIIYRDVNPSDTITKNVIEEGYPQRNRNTEKYEVIPLTRRHAMSTLNHSRLQPSN